MEMRRWVIMFLMIYVGEHFTDVFYMDLGMKGSAQSLYQLVRQQVAFRVDAIRLRFDDDPLKARRRSRGIGKTYMGLSDTQNQCEVRRGPLHPILTNTRYLADSEGKYCRIRRG